MLRVSIVIAVLMCSASLVQAQLTTSASIPQPPTLQPTSAIMAIASEHDIMDRQPALAIEVEYVAKNRVATSDPKQRQQLTTRELQIRLLMQNSSPEQQQALQRLISGGDVLPGEVSVEQLSQAMDIVPMYRKEFATSAGADVIMDNILIGISAAPANDHLMLDLVDQSIWIGEYSFAKKVSELKGADGKLLYDDYAFAQLQARASTGEYRQAASSSNVGNGWPNRTVTAQLIRLSHENLSAYQNAFALAPDDFEKILVAAEWMRLLHDSYYDADSKEMRDFIFSRLDSTESTPAYEEQLKAFAASVEQILPIVHDAQKWTPENRIACANSLNTAFARVARLGIPDEVFQGILRGLPTFIDEQFTPADPKNPWINDDTVRWYFWEAVTQRMPTRQQKRYLDQAANQAIAYMEFYLDVSKEEPALLPYRNQFIDEFKREYAQGLSDRMAPHFKLPMLPHRRERQFDLMRESMNSEAAHFHQDLVANGIYFRKMIGQEAKFHARSIYKAAYAELTFHTLPAINLPPPDQCIVTTGSTFNSQNLWVTEIGRTLPMAPFPKHGQFLNYP